MEKLLNETNHNIIKDIFSNANENVKNFKSKKGSLY